MVRNVLRVDLVIFLLSFGLGMKSASGSPIYNYFFLPGFSFTDTEDSQQHGEG